MNELIGSNIMTLRKEKGLTQEQLANALGISFQAVSKWETGNSCPDISMLPMLADLFGVTVDQIIGRVPLMTAPEDPIHEAPAGGPLQSDSLPWPDDDTFYAVLFHGHSLVDYQEGDRELEKARTHFVFHYKGAAQNISSAFSVRLDGRVSGNIDAGESVACGDVDGDVIAGENVICGDVDGNVRAGGNVNCDDVEGSVNSGGSVNCDDVGGDVVARASVSCDSIRGRANGGIPFDEEAFEKRMEKFNEKTTEFSMKAADFGRELGQKISEMVNKTFASGGFDPGTDPFSTDDTDQT